MLLLSSIQRTGVNQSGQEGNQQVFGVNVSLVPKPPPIKATQRTRASVTQGERLSANGMHHLSRPGW
jgi:hypothetical protein